MLFNEALHANLDDLFVVRASLRGLKDCHSLCGRVDSYCNTICQAPPESFDHPLDNYFVGKEFYRNDFQGRNVMDVFVGSFECGGIVAPLFSFLPRILIYNKAARDGVLEETYAHSYMQHDFSNFLMVLSYLPKNDAFWNDVGMLFDEVLPPCVLGRSFNPEELATYFLAPLRKP